MEFRYGSSSMQGRRPDNEDALLINDNLIQQQRQQQHYHHALFCVLDGHGGSDASNYASEELTEFLLNTEEWQNYVQKVSPYLLPNVNKKKRGGSGSGTGSIRVDIPNNKAMKELTNLLESALIRSFVELDRELYIQHHYDHDNSNNNNDGGKRQAKKPPSSTPGSTAIAVLVTPFVLVCANIGDSRCVLACSSTSSPMSLTANPLSFDHTPNIRDDEKQRIIKAGGYVTEDDGRVDGELAVSRAFGDFELKDIDGLLLDDYNPLENDDDVEQLLHRAKQQKVSAYPEIHIHQRDDTIDRFIVLACDGIWDVMSNEDCIEYIASALHQQGQNYDLELICEQLLDKCFQLGSQDNMTIILILLEAGQKLIGKTKTNIAAAAAATTTATASNLSGGRTTRRKQR